jgi:ribosomal protein S13
LLDAANLSDEPSLEEISTAVQNSESAYDMWVNAHLADDAQVDIDSAALIELYVQYRHLDGLEMYDSMEALREACEAVDDD